MYFLCLFLSEERIMSLSGGVGRGGGGGGLGVWGGGGAPPPGDTLNVLFTRKPEMECVVIGWKECVP
jgi:hypothetical protein